MEYGRGVVSRGSKVFVDNLSHRVSKEALWEAFDAYGRVVDVYIGTMNNPRRYKSTTFAFVRFKTFAEMQKAVQEGNNTLIDGWYIRVKRASFGWKDRNHFEKVVKGFPKKVASSYHLNKLIPDSSIDYRSFKEVVIGRGRNDAALENAEDMEWLHKCAAGQVGDSSMLSLDQEMLLNAKVNCSVCLMGGFTVALIFDSKEEMLPILTDAKDLFNDLFEDLWPWKASLVPGRLLYGLSWRIFLWKLGIQSFLCFWQTSGGTFIKLEDQAYSRKSNSFTVSISVEDFSNLHVGSDSSSDQHGGEKKDESSCFRQREVGVSAPLNVYVDIGKGYIDPTSAVEGDDVNLDNMGLVVGCGNVPYLGPNDFNGMHGLEFRDYGPSLSYGVYETRLQEVGSGSNIGMIVPLSIF
ncbi:hypothetical protein PTKIN_Ptkin14bG0135200 [Pterospermum kingtungense]